MQGGVVTDLGDGGRQLEGGWEQRGLFEREGVVFRTPGMQSPAVLGLLRHLEAQGFPASPRVVGSGFDVDGRETLGFVDGDVHRLGPWSEAALGELGRLLRFLHDVTRNYPADGRVWRPNFMRSLPGDEPVIGHCDLGPWNIVERGGHPVAFIDWDMAGPVDAMWDLAHVAWLNVQLHDDDVAEFQGLGNAAARAAHLAIFVDGYGLPRASRELLVERIAEVAIHEARDEATRAGITRNSTAAVLDNGYPILWAVTWRARSASWILRHQQLLRAAIVG